MEPTGLLMATLIIGLLVLALGIDQATEDALQESAVVSEPGHKTPRRSNDKHR